MNLKAFFKAISKAWLPLCFSVIVILLTAVGLFQHYKGVGFAHEFIFKLETALLDFKFKLRGELDPKANVGILAIDEKTLQQFGRWPYSRAYYEQAFENLKALGVAWIGFDVIFSEPERASLDDVDSTLTALMQDTKKSSIDQSLIKAKERIAQFKEVSPADASLSAAIGSFENIVMGYFYFLSKYEIEDAGIAKHPFRGLDYMAENSAVQIVDIPGGRNLADYSYNLHARGLIANQPAISESGIHFGFFSNEPDDDAVIRWVTLIKVIDGHVMPSLALKIAAESQNREIAVFMEKNGSGIESIELVNRDDEADSYKIPLDPLGQGRILANHRGPSKAFRHISLADAYNNDFTPEERKGLQGAILLLGPTAIGINDQRPNPFDPVLPGVENHAVAVDNILGRDFLQRPVSIYNKELLLVLIIGLLFTPIMIYTRAVTSGVLVVVFLAAFYYLDKILWFEKQGLWVYMGMPFLETLSLFVGITLYKYVTEEKEKKKVKGAFAHYLSPEVINQVLDDPSALQLGGEKKPLTVFFSDVRGFTTISENLSPEKLCEFMNEYFTPMTSIILRSGGVLDKYIGDAIMAFWGAPLPLPDQADRAAESSIRMLYALEEVQASFKQKGFPHIDIGIGLNTGPMSVGNMGSGERFCYTVMGDSVNLGARLEGLTKDYGIKILISEFTQAKLTPGKFFTRDLDDIRVKGKNEPVKVFDLMRPDLCKTQDMMHGLVGEFELGRKAYRDQDWKKSEAHFMNCMKIKPGDGPTELYLARVQSFMKESPGDQWDGVYTFKHK